MATAANAGMDASTGDFIGFADGDDLYDPQMFERLYEAAMAHSADLTMCGYTLLDASTGAVANPADIDRWRAYPQETAFDLDDTTRRAMLQFISVPWRKIYRRDLVERINLRFPVGDYFFEDNPFHWASIVGGQRIALVPEKLCQHRVSRVGQTIATVDSRLLRLFQHHDNIRDWLRLHGHAENYEDDLLTWTANQLSWVSQRAEGPLQRELYDALLPIIDQYDAEAIEKFGARNSRGRTFKMLKALKAADFADCTRAASPKAPATSVKPATVIKVQSGRGNTLLSRGLFHLKHKGLRETLRMTGRYMSSRVGIAPEKQDSRGTFGKKSSNARVTNEDLIAALAVLQSDMRNLRSDVAKLRSPSEGVSKPGLDA